MAEQPAGDRRGGIHVGGDLTVSGEGHRVAGGDIIEAETYIKTITTAIVQEAAPPPASLGLLPPDVADFTGRDTELDKLEADLLAAHGQAVVISAVHGKPGVGKSALAVHLAHKLASQFPDGQVYINLRGADQQPLPADTALTELLHVLGISAEQQPTSLDGKAALWRQQVAGKQVLVVLDNAHDEAQVRPLLPGSPTSAVIVTSRAALVTLGAKPLLLDILDPDQALELLGKIAGPKRIEAERQAALAVVGVCGGLPLALRIAGARLAARVDWSVAKLAERLADARLRLAELGMGDLDVRASFELSYQELPDPQARAFRLLALWPGTDFRPWVVAAVLDADSETAEGLVNGLVAAQLVEPATVPGRFRMHDLLMLFAAEQLDQQEPEPDRDITRARLAEAALDLAHRLALALEPPGLHPEQHAETRIPREVALSWLDAEWDGLVAVAGQAAERGPWAVAWRMAERLNPFLAFRGYWADQERANRWAVQAARQADNHAAEGRALSNLGNVLAVLYGQGHWDEAVDCNRQALAICREFGDRHGEGKALTNLGAVLADQGHRDQAIDHYQQALAIFEQLGAPEAARVKHALAQLEQPRHRWWPFGRSRK